MKSLMLFLAFPILLLVSCSIDQTRMATEDEIVGRWKTEMDSWITSIAVIEKNHTAKFGMDSCEWSYEDGKYLIWGKGSPKDSLWTGKIDAKGRLVLRDTKRPESFARDRDPLIYERAAESDQGGFSSVGETPVAKVPAAQTRSAAGATAHKGLEDKFIGRWKGITCSVLVVFEKDHTIMVGDVPGEWSYEDGKALIWAKGDAKNSGSTCSIDANGRLVLADSRPPKHPEDRMTLLFQREDVAKSESAAVSAEESAVPQKGLLGAWLFAYTRKSLKPVAPPFDNMIFRDQKKVMLRATEPPSYFEKDYTLSGNTIMIPTDYLDYPDIHFGYRLENNEKTLVLSNLRVTRGRYTSGFPYDCDWVFLRPQQFPPNDLAGKWEVKPEDGRSRQIVELQGDGHFIKEGKLSGYYRLWSSGFGKSITLVTHASDSGLQTVMFRYERKNDQVIMTPLELDHGDKLQLVEKGREVWKLK